MGGGEPDDEMEGDVIFADADWISYGGEFLGYRI